MLGSHSTEKVPPPPPPFQWHLYLSYRADEGLDATLAAIVHQLQEAGLQVATSGSADGAIDELLASAIVVPVLSKRALEPFASLDAGSSCDTLLLEMRLAVTLEEREELAFIMPLLVGSATDDLGHGLGVGFRDFFKEGAVPRCSDAPVASVESAASALLERHGLPRLEEAGCGAKTALDGILAHQGVFLRGIQADAMSTATDRLIAKAFQLAPDQASAHGSEYLSTGSAWCSSGDEAASDNVPHNARKSMQTVKILHPGREGRAGLHAPHVSSPSVTGSTVKARASVVRDARRRSDAYADGVRPRGASMAVFQDQGQGSTVTTIEAVSAGKAVHSGKEGRRSKVEPRIRALSSSGTTAEAGNSQAHARNARRRSEVSADGVRPRGASMAVFRDQGLQGGSVTTIEEVQLEVLASAQRRMDVEGVMSTEGHHTATTHDDSHRARTLRCAPCRTSRCIYSRCLWTSDTYMCS